MKILFKIVTPERIVFEERVDAVTLPTQSGEITVLPSHMPLVSMLKAGEVLVCKDGEKIPLAVSSGVIEVNENRLTVLADTADRLDELQEDKVEKAREGALKLMQEKRADTEGFAEASAILERELARLKVVRKYRKSRGSIPGNNQ